VDRFGFCGARADTRVGMALGIQTHLAGLSLSHTVDLLNALGVKRSRKAIHDWVQKAELQPDAGQSPNYVALDEINDEQYWLYAAADPATNHLLHVRLVPRLRPHSLRSSSENSTRNTMSKLRCFSSMAPNISKLLSASELKRRTSSFSNCSSHVHPETAESWLQTVVLWHNAAN